MTVFTYKKLGKNSTFSFVLFTTKVSSSFRRLPPQLPSLSSISQPHSLFHPNIVLLQCFNPITTIRIFILNSILFKFLLFESFIGLAKHDVIRLGSVYMKPNHFNLVPFLFSAFAKPNLFWSEKESIVIIAKNNRMKKVK